MTTKVKEINKCLLLLLLHLSFLQNISNVKYRSKDFQRAKKILHSNIHVNSFMFMIDIHIVQKKRY